MSRSASRAPRDQQCPPRRRRRPSRSVVLLLALLAATFVSVGSALADEEAAPPAPEPATAMPDDVVISDPEVQTVVEEAPEPAAPAAEAPAEPAAAPDVAPSDAAPVEASPVEAAPAAAAEAVDEAEAPVAAEAFAAEAAEGAAPAEAPAPAARVATTEPAIQARVQVCPDPAWPASYSSGGSCKINICHATGADENNPFVFIQPNVNSLNGHFSGNHQQNEDVILPPTGTAADCPGGTTEDACPADAPDGAYVNENGQCVIDYCHADANGGFTAHVGEPLASLNGHDGHANDLIPMPLGGCPTDTPDCEPPSFLDGGTCKVNICHATGSESNPWEFITVAAQGLEGHGDHPDDIIGVASEADCVAPNDCDPPAYEDTNGRCVIDICHAEGDPIDYTAMTILLSQRPTHDAHPNDIIPAPENGCPADEADCEPPAYEDTNGRCVIDICEAVGSPVAGWTLMTILASQLPAHASHTADIIPAPETGCPPDVDYCPGPLNPGTQPYGTTCIDDACPDELNPGNQPFGATCIGDACPGVLNPGNQAPGTVCIVDACPDALNPGNQAPGTTCITDACPDQLNPGNQPAGTACAVPTVPTPTPSVPTPTAPTPAAPTPAEPTPTPAEPTPPEVVEVTPQPEEPTVVLGEQVEPTPVTAGVGTLPFTGARTFGLTLLGVIAFLAGAALVRRRPRRTS